MKTVTAVFIVCLLFVTPGRSHAALIEQVFQFDSVGSFTSIEHVFEPFDAALGTLVSVQIGANTTSRMLLDQFECDLESWFQCDLNTYSETVLAVEFGAGCCVDTAGHSVYPSVDTGLWGGAVTSEVAYITADSQGVNGLFDLEDFYTLPVEYRGTNEWYCTSCRSVADPLLINHFAAAWVTFEYTPTEIPLPSTAALLLVALGGLVTAPGIIRLSGRLTQRGT